MDKAIGFRLVPILGLALLIGCAAPAPTATPTQPPAAAPTSTKAPTATPTKRPLVKAVIAVPSRNFPQTTWTVAEAKGYYREEGLDAEIVVAGSGSKALAAVVGQSAHITTANAAEQLSAVAQGQPVQTIAAGANGVTMSLVLRKTIAEKLGISEKSGLTERVNALKGLKIANSAPGSGNDNAARFVLNRFSINPERDIEFAYVGVQAIYPAFESGAVDAYVAAEPDVSKAVVAGTGIRLVVITRDIPETAQNIDTAIATHKNVIASQPEIPEAFVRALWRAMRLLKENRADAEEAYRKTAFPDMDPALFKTAFDDVYARHFPASPAITREQFQATLDYRSKSQNEPLLPVKYEELYNPRFVEAAKKQLGF